MKYFLSITTNPNEGTSWILALFDTKELGKKFIKDNQDTLNKFDSHCLTEENIAHNPKSIDETYLGLNPA